MTDDHGPAGDIIRTPDDTQAGRRYRHRFMRTSDAPHGPNHLHLQALARARISELSRKRPPRADKFSRVRMERLRQRGGDLLARFQWETDTVSAPQDQIDVMEFANWVMSRKPELLSNSWSECRAAARAVIETLPHDRQPIALGMIDADADDVHGQAHVRRAGADVMQRHSRIEKEDFDKVFREMPAVSRSEAVPWLADAMIATINTGTPWICWPTTTLEVWTPPGHPVRTILHVVHPDSAVSPAPFARSLDISGFSPEVRGSIRQMVRNAHTWTMARDFHYRQTRINQCLYAVCDRLFPRMRYPFDFFTLVSQFRANMRAVRSSAVAAALTGDICEIAPRRYLKSRQAWPTDAITEIPVPDDVAVRMMERRIGYHLMREKAKAARMDLAERRRAARAARELMQGEKEP